MSPLLGGAAIAWPLATSLLLFAALHKSGCGHLASISERPLRGRSWVRSGHASGGQMARMTPSRHQTINFAVMHTGVIAA